MVDGFNPPVASRVYVYPHLAHYAVLRLFRPDKCPDDLSFLNDWPVMPEIDTVGAHGELTALLTFAKVARLVVFSEYEMDTLTAELLRKAHGLGLAESRIAAAEKIASALTAQLKPWILADQYVQTRTMDRYTSSRTPGHWDETPPDYAAALEPNWSRIRPLAIDSASFHTVPPMPHYSTDPGSGFRTMVEEVHSMSIALPDSARHIALYWDDNPNISSHRGHLHTLEHRISPPGHWLNIISQVSRTNGSDVYTTSRAYALSAVAMFDAVINCWHEKFRTDVVRPITYINELTDPDWASLIQTPPFPEYPSGHSAVSAAAATVMENIFGSKHAFTDSTEIIFGLGTREFTGFHEAAWEVSMSRFYGGIHYMPSIREGNVMGRRIGAYVLEMARKRSG